MTGLWFNLMSNINLTEKISFAATAVKSSAVSTSDTTDAATEAAAQTIADATDEVTSAWNLFQQNIPALISFGIRVVLCIVVFIIGRFVIKWIRKVVRHSMERANADKGVMQFIDSLLKFLLYAILIFSIAVKLGVESTSVAALLASGGVAVGLALQGTLSNFAGGVLILLLKPFVVGDYIIEDSGKNEGTVKEIQIFYTKLSTVDNKIIVIPNGTLANSTLTNTTEASMRQLDLRVGISYQADLKKAKEILRKLIEESKLIEEQKEHRVFVSDLADSAVILGIRAWVKTEDYWNARWQFLEDIKYQFDENGIEIPYNQLTVHVEREEN